MEWLGEIFLVPLEKESDSLLRIIQKWIFLGTTIYSDCWKTYDCRNEEVYIHQKVNHSLNFVDLDSGVRTNNNEKQ